MPTIRHRQAELSSCFVRISQEEKDGVEHGPGHRPTDMETVPRVFHGRRLKFDYLRDLLRKVALTKRHLLCEHLHDTGV
jgi:hypothetical protein